MGDEFVCSCFDRIPLLINYHRLVAANNVTGWGEVAPDTDYLLQSAIDKGYSLRHDAFGMNGYYQDWEKNMRHVGIINVLLLWRAVG